MPEYLSPGVYVEEIDSGPRPIEGVGTATAAFVGLAPAGPANRPMLVTNWSQYVDTFGALEDGGGRNPHLTGTYLSHSVYGYFLNGGGRCYVTRVVPGPTNGQTPGGTAAPALQLPSRSSKALPSLTITPKDGLLEDLQVEIRPPSDDTALDGTFTLQLRMGGVDESYDNVSLGKRGGRNVVETVNQASKLVTIVEEAGTGTIAERMPEVGSYLLKAQPAGRAAAGGGDALHRRCDHPQRHGRIRDRRRRHDGLLPRPDGGLSDGRDRPRRRQGGATRDDRPLRADGRPRRDPRPAPRSIAARGQSLA